MVKYLSLIAIVALVGLGCSRKIIYSRSNGLIYSKGVVYQDTCDCCPNFRGVSMLMPCDLTPVFVVKATTSNTHSILDSIFHAEKPFDKVDTIK